MLLRLWELWAADAVHQIDGRPARAGRHWMQELAPAGYGFMSSLATSAAPAARRHFTADAAEVVALIRRMASLDRRTRAAATSTWPSRRCSPTRKPPLLDLRRSRRLGIKQLRSQLLRQHGLGLLLDTLHRILVRHGQQHLKRPKLTRKGKKRYSRPVPGDRGADRCRKIVPAVYQCRRPSTTVRATEFGVYRRRTRRTQWTSGATDRGDPFPIQRIQSDRGLEFFAEKVQRRLMDWAIKFRPIKPRSPHLNGKVERSQRADLEEFWPTVDPRSPDVGERLAEWQHFWNWEQAPQRARPGKTPIDPDLRTAGENPLSRDR